MPGKPNQAPSSNLNRFKPDKLHLSKWTAVMPQKKRKHFLVVELNRDPLTDEVISCVLEAVIDKHQTLLDWRELKDPTRWRQGWKY